MLCYENRFVGHFAGVEDKRDNVAEKMDRLVAAVARSRERGPTQRRLDRGEQLENVIRLAEEFPVRRRGQLRYPVLKRLGWNKRWSAERAPTSTRRSELRE